MADSDDDEILFSTTRSNQQARGLLGNGVKNIDDIMNGPKEDRRLKKTLALCAAFLGLGLAIAVIGPTLLALKEHLGVAFPKMSYIFMGRSIGYLAGSILGGVMFEWFHPSVLISVTLLAGGIGLIVAPFCSHLWSLATVIAMVGVAMGGLDTGANVVCLRLWGKRSSPFLQALHFCFAVGAFIAPLLASPFIATGGVPLNTSEITTMMNTIAPTGSVAETVLTTSSIVLDNGTMTLPVVNTTQINSTTMEVLSSAPASDTTTSVYSSTIGDTTQHHSTAVEVLSSAPESTTITSVSNRTTLVATAINGTTNNTRGDKKRRSADDDTDEHDEYDEDDDSEPVDSPSQFQNVYIIIGLFNMLVSLSFFYFFCTSPVRPQSADLGSTKDGNSKNKDFKNTVLFLMFIFYFLYVGAEISFGGYIFTFATKCSGLEYDESTASLLNSAFWGAFAVGRGLSICLASVVLPHVMLVMDMIGCILSSVALATYGDNGGMVLWVGTIVLGLSMASLFPAGISWLGSYYKMTGNMASVLIIGSALGEMIFPLLVGVMFEESTPDGYTPDFLHIGPMSLMYVMLASSCLTVVIFAVMQYLAKQQGVEQVNSLMTNPAEDIKIGVHEAFSMDEVGPSAANKQKTKMIIPKPLRIKKHTA